VKVDTDYRDLLATLSMTRRDRHAVPSHFELAIAGAARRQARPRREADDGALATSAALIDEADAAARADGRPHLRLHGAVQKMRELTSAASSATSTTTTRSAINLGLFQHDVNVLWDLAVHDSRSWTTCSGSAVAVSRRLAHVPVSPRTSPT
jgi:hypothetical protein